MPALGGGGGGGGPWDYVQDAQPTDPDVAETWYDTGEGRGFMWNGTRWREVSVVDHAELEGTGASDHHTRYADSEARSAVEAGNLSRIDGDNSHRILFTNASYVEVVDQSNNRQNLVTADTYINNLSGGTWLADIAHGDLGGIGASDHHSKPTGTQSKSISGGYQYTDQDTSSDGDTGTVYSWGGGETKTYDMGDAIIDGVRVYNDTAESTKDFTFELLDSSGTALDSFSYTINTFDGWEEFNFNDLGAQVRANNTEATSTGVAEIQPHKTVLPSHSHSI
jgi:hypothetical protein